MSKEAVLRGLLVVTQAATLWVMWPLWQLRNDPPLLPLFPLPAMPFGVLLALTLVWVLVQPRWGVWAHLLALLAAIACDRTRLQPQVLSPALLLVCTLGFPSARLLGLGHLAALWFFSGFHKLLSAQHPINFGHGIVRALFPGVTLTQSEWIAEGLALGEVLLGLSLFVPRLRRVAACGGALLHLSIFIALSPLGLNGNESVWPWNLGLAVVAPILILTTAESFGALWKRGSRVVRTAVVVLLMSPFGFYVDLVNPYLAHILYASCEPKAHWYHAQTREIEKLRKLPTLRTYLPPSHAVYEAYFRARSEPGDRLRIVDTRWWARWRGREEIILRRSE